MKFGFSRQNVFSIHDNRCIDSVFNSDKQAKMHSSISASKARACEFFTCSKSAYTKQAGLTLLEMMIALAVAAIVLTVVAPSIQSIVGKNRIVAEINEFSSVVQFARYTAIDQSSNTVVCPAADFANCSTNWDQPKIVFIDNNSNNQRDSSEPLLMTSEAISSKNTMSGPNTPIIFFDSGATNANISVKICPDNNNAAIARAININAQGRVRVSVDSNNDGIYEDTDGNAITCT